MTCRICGWESCLCGVIEDRDDGDEHRDPPPPPPIVVYKDDNITCAIYARQSINLNARFLAEIEVGNAWFRTKRPPHALGQAVTEAFVTAVKAGVRKL